jgi:hypothetical protein
MVESPTGESIHIPDNLWTKMMELGIQPFTVAFYELNIPHINPRPLGRRKKYSRVILSPWYLNIGMGDTLNIG